MYAEVKNCCFEAAKILRWALAKLSMAYMGGGALALAMIWPAVAPADDAMDRCWQVKLGMSLEQVNRMLGSHLPMGGGTPVAGGKYFPCFLRIHNFGVSEIQIGYRRAAPPNEAMFSEALKRGVAAWGRPDSISFSENRLRWFVIWGYSEKNQETLIIEPEPNKELFIGRIGSYIYYMLQK